MLRSIYAMNLASVALVMFTLQIIWSCAGAKCHRLWKTVNALLAVFAVAAILYTTVFTRSPGEHEVKLRPFAALIAAKKQPELYRAMFMNIFLFFRTEFFVGAARKAGRGAGDRHGARRISAQRGDRVRAVQVRARSRRSRRCNLQHTRRARRKSIADRRKTA